MSGFMLAVDYVEFGSMRTLPVVIIRGSLIYFLQVENAISLAKGTAISGVL